MIYLHAMMVILKIFYESSLQALGSLMGNKLRTFLSLLGITIGIFCIIAIKSAVDSLEKNILDGFQELGSDVIYVDKFPWNEDPNQNYWKYAKRPDPSYNDFEMISERSKLAEVASYTIFTGGKTIKYKSSSVEDAYIMGTTSGYKDIIDCPLTAGRQFSPLEYQSGSNVIVLGYNVADALFGKINPLGKSVKLFGQKYQVIGVLEEEGDNMFNFIDHDDVMWVTYANVKRFVNTKDKSNVGRLLSIKAKEGEETKDLKGELTSLLRRSRRLRPIEKDNFALNEMSTLATVIEGVMGALNIAGYFIGFFSILIGMFSVANIMFVSVKERTNLIGIKKAIGAKHYMILLEFLVESVILCIVGGLIGLVFVWGLLTFITNATDFAMGLSLTNMVIGVVISVVVGILSGIIPAWRASRLDPVVAMRG